jgi:hypothetical protein
MQSKRRPIMTNRFQLTVAFGSGERGAKWDALVTKLAKRFKLDPTDLMRVAILTLDRVDKNDAITEHELLSK